MGLDLRRYLIPVQGGRAYLPVQARVLWFRRDHPDWGIVTTAVEINLMPDGNSPPYAVFQSQIFNAEGRLMATGTKMEDARGFGDFVEKAETGSVGRALALCGYGTLFAQELGVLLSGQEPDAAGASPVPAPALPSAGNRFAARARELGFDVETDGKTDTEKARLLAREVLAFEGSPVPPVLASTDYEKARGLLPSYREGLRNPTGYHLGVV